VLDRSPPQAPAAFFDSLVAWCRRPARGAGNGLFCGGYPSPPSNCPSVSVALSLIAEMSSSIDRNRKSRARRRARKRPDRTHIRLARVARKRACPAAPNPGRAGTAVARLPADASRWGKHSPGDGLAEAIFTVRNRQSVLNVCATAARRAGEGHSELAREPGVGSNRALRRAGAQASGARSRRAGG
jgi:hypothetical protein